MKEIIISLILRILIASPLFYIGISGWAGFASPFLVLAGGIILARPFASLLAEPFGKLFWSGERFDRPQPMYGIPQSKRAKGLYEESMAGFAKIAKDYPNEVQPYIEMIDIAIINLKNPERANRIFQDGISALSKDEDKEALAKVYSAIRTRLNSKPSN